jgi:superfamily II DNA or RNA helicase
MMPTGSGKSLLAMYLINELRVKTLILVHKKNLMEQWKKGIEKTLNYEPGLYGDGIRNIKPITIGMIQTIAKDKSFNINYFDFVCSDECHHLPSVETYNIVMKSNAYYRLGLSATPTREDGNEMKMFAAMGPIVKVATIKELIQSGVLAKPKIEYMNAPPGPGGNTYAMMYKNNITMNTMRNQMIAQKAQSLEKKGLSVLITVNQIRHGKTLEAMIAGSKFVHGQTPKEERIQAMEDFEQGKMKVMVSTLLNEGSDIPTLDCIILAGGGKSESAQIQKIGRALRTTDTKKHALIIDVLDQGKWLRDHAQQRIKLYSEVFG